MLRFNFNQVKNNVMGNIIRFIFRTKHRYTGWQQFFILAKIAVIVFLICCYIQLLN